MNFRAANQTWQQAPRWVRTLPALGIVILAALVFAPSIYSYVTSPVDGEYTVGSEGMMVVSVPRSADGSDGTCVARNGHVEFSNGRATWQTDELVDPESGTVHCAPGEQLGTEADGGLVLTGSGG